MPATFVLSGGRTQVVSDDKTHKLVSPSLTVDCINIQWAVSIVATQSWIAYGVNVRSNTGTEQAVGPPKPKMVLESGSLSGTTLNPPAATQNPPAVATPNSPSWRERISA
jgi:hypothetical protein